MLARWFYRTRFALKFAVVGLAVAGPLLFACAMALSAFQAQVRSLHAVERALDDADHIRTLAIAIARHRGLSASVLAGGEDVSSRLVAEQRTMFEQLDRVLVRLADGALHAIGLPDPAGLKAELQQLSQLPADLGAGENFERHNAVISALLGASARLALGLAQQPESAVQNDVVFVQLPMLIEELGRQRGWGSAILTHQQATPDDLRTYLFYAGAVARRLELVRADRATLDRLDRMHGGLGEPLRSALAEAAAFHRRSIRAVERPLADDTAGQRHFADGTAVIDRVVAVNESLVAARRADTAQALQQAHWARGLALIGALAIMALLGRVYREFSHTTVRRLRVLGQATERLAASDFQTPIGVEGRDEIAQLGQALEAARVQLRNALAERARGLAALEADRAKTAFMARWSHDLRTPLHAVLGFADLIEGRPGPRLSLAQRQDLQRIRQAGQHLLRLVNDVLDITQPAGAGIPLQLASHDVHEALDEALALLLPQAEAAAVALQLHPLARASAQDSGRQRVLADRARLVQVLGQLVGNAIRHSPPAGQVVLRLRHRAAEIGVVVEDQGPGIPQARQGALFEPFGAASDDGRAGSGLGLPLSQRLAQLMGGRIEVQSAPGRGSCFTLWLPRASTLQPKDAAAAADAGATVVAGAVADVPNETAALPPVNASGRLAYVEDDPVNVLLVREMLAGLTGVELQVFGGVQAALQAARAGARFDLWLVDRQLPDGDGIGLLLQLNADAAAAGQPPPHAVMLSADALPGSAEPALAAGFAAYWTKPVALHVLRQGVAAQLARVRAAGLATISGSGELPP